MRYTLLSIILTMTATVFWGQEIKTLTPSIEPLEFSKEGEQRYLREQANFEKAYKLIENGKKLEELPIVYQDAYNNYDEMSTYWGVGSEGCSWYCGGGPKEVTASSFLPSQGITNYSPVNAHDLNYKSAWVEGVEGYGEGEYLLYTFDAYSPRITKIVVVNGYVKSEKAWRENSRVKKLKMYIDDEPYAILNLKDLRAANHFTVDPIGMEDRTNLESYYGQNSTLKFEILEVYPGEKYEDTVISEIYFDGIDVHCFAAGTLITMSDHKQKPIELLRTGDQVVSYDPESKTYSAASIEEMAHHTHTDMITITFDNNSMVTCTPDHPLLSAGGTWLSYHPAKTMQDYAYDQVGLLQIGSVLMGEGEKRTITAIQTQAIAQPTHTIVRLDTGTSFIANGIIVGTEPLRDKVECRHSSKK